MNCDRLGKNKETWNRISKKRYVTKRKMRFPGFLGERFDGFWEWGTTETIAGADHEFAGQVNPGSVPAICI